MRRGLKGVLYLSRTEFLFNYLPGHLIDGFSFGIALRILASQIGLHITSIISDECQNRTDESRRWLDVNSFFSFIVCGDRLARSV